jgi:hypothetical protein
MRDSRRRQAGVEFLWMTIRLRKNPVSILKWWQLLKGKAFFLHFPSSFPLFA